VVIALSRSHHAPGNVTPGNVTPGNVTPGNVTPHIPVGYQVHVDEVLKRYTPDKDQAIHRMISCQTMYPMKLELRHLAIVEYQ